MVDCVLKFCSGEEVFASIITVENDKITFEDPMVIKKRYVETASGLNIQLNFEPFLDYNSNRHTFDKQHIMSCEPLIPRLQSLYVDMKRTTKDIVQECKPLAGNITLH